MREAITTVPGVRVGHYTDSANATGCTVVLFEQGAVGGVDVRGAAPGTREIDLLRPGNLVERIHAIVLSGGSAYGLDAASGVMKYLEEQGIGFQIGPTIVPIVASAILFDLGLVTHEVRPGPEEGYQACKHASSEQVREGSVGAGTGATVGKILGMHRAVKGGLGTTCIDLGDGLLVGAIVAVNSIGSVIDPATNQILAGPRKEDSSGFLDTVELMVQPGFQATESQVPTNTTIGVVATNATLTKEDVHRLAIMAQDGISIAVRPSHTMADGDVVFAVATGEGKASVNHGSLSRLGAAAAEAMSRAIARAIDKATAIGGIPSAREVVDA